MLPKPTSSRAELYSLALVKALGVHSEDAYDRRFGGMVYVFLPRAAVAPARPVKGSILPGPPGPRFSATSRS